MPAEHKANNIYIKPLEYIFKQWEIQVSLTVVKYRSSVPIKIKKYTISLHHFRRKNEKTL